MDSDGKWNFTRSGGSTGSSAAFSLTFWNKTDMVTVDRPNREMISYIYPRIQEDAKCCVMPLPIGLQTAKEHAEGSAVWQ